ncbi:hypothetical protein ACWGJW_02580 [Streptomyces nigrescens]
MMTDKGTAQAWDILTQIKRRKLEAMTPYEVIVDALNNGATLPDLSPRMAAVLIAGLAERAGATIPDSERGNSEEAAEEADVMLDYIAAQMID